MGSRAGREKPGRGVLVRKKLTFLEICAKEMGITLDREAVRKESMEGTPGLEASGRILEVEIAGLRLVLRRTLRVALEAEGVEDCMRLGEIYRHECLRLLRLQEHEKSAEDVLQAYLLECLGQAVKKLEEEREGRSGSRRVGQSANLEEYPAEFDI